MNKEVSKDIARKRLEEALETGAKYLPTSCPFCKTWFDNIANGKIVVKDITELLLETLNKTFANESTRICKLKQLLYSSRKLNFNICRKILRR
ncbi:MAG: hypothetical protein DRO23_09245 [Thermoprotei archaeon]|nr:MAG: hypothetical protein DRO23_09245 [Thermoprotei archaeon]